MRYDETKHDEAVARRAKIDQELTEVSARMNEEQAKDTAWDSARFNAYMANEAQHARLSRDLAAADREIDRWETIKPTAQERVKTEPGVLERFLRRGFDGISSDERREHAEILGNAGFRRENGIAIRNITTSDGTSGQNAVDEETVPRIVARLANFGGARMVAQNWRTARGNPIQVPRVDASQQVGEIIASQGTGVGSELGLPDIGRTELAAYTYQSRPIQVSMEAVEDVEWDIGGYIENEAVRRLGRATNAHFTTGTGSSQPMGFVTVATRGVTAAAAAAVTWQELVDLQYAVDSAYLDGGEMGMGGVVAEGGSGMTGYTMSRTMEQLIRKLADGENRPLWIPSLTSDKPNMLHGYPYVLNFDMDAPTTGEMPIVFGNFNYFVTRSVGTVAVYDFWDSRTAQNNVREILAFCRDDADAIGPLVSGRCPAFATLTMA